MVDVYTERNRRQERESGEVRELGFDPEAFGFELYVPKRFAGPRGASDKDYITYVDGTDKTNRYMYLSMCEETAEFIVELIGEAINIYVNEKGQLLICPGSISHIAQKNKGVRRRNVSMNGLMDKMFECHGRFKRLYLTCKPYAKGNAVIFAPSGERDLL